MSEDKVSDLEWNILSDQAAKRCAAGLLTFWAGTINGLATVALVFGRVSHMSGRIIDQGQFLFSNPLGSLFVTTLVFAFFAGTVVGTIILPRFKLTRALVLAMVPIVIAIILVSFGIHGSSAQSFEPARFILAFLLPLGMGMQNSVTSQTRLGRTTHMTGELTDLGICVGKGQWARALFLFTKYAAFFLGGMLGYVGSVFSPLLTLALGATGVILTALYYEYSDAQREYTQHKEQVFH